MVRRTTIELDEQLVERAKLALGCTTTRGTVELALRRVADNADREHDEAKERLHEWFRVMPTMLDLDVLASDEMWR